MPSRILRDWTDSDAVSQLDAPSERLFIRLIMKADDFGRFTANVRLIRSLCFPLQDVREADISRQLAACEQAGLIRLYEVSGKHFVLIENFKQRLRKMKSAYPAPPTGDTHQVGNNPSIADQLTDKCQSVASETPPDLDSDLDLDSEDLHTHAGWKHGLSCPNGPSPAFLKFADVFPKWSGEAAAWIAWQAEVWRLVSQKGMTDLQAEQTIMAGAVRYRDSPAGQPPDNPIDDFRMSPEKWLKGGHHADSDEKLATPNRRTERSRPGHRRASAKTAAARSEADESLADIFDRCAESTKRMEARPAGVVSESGAAIELAAVP